MIIHTTYQPAPTGQRDTEFYFPNTLGLQKQKEKTHSFNKYLSVTYHRLDMGLGSRNTTVSQNTDGLT